MSAVVKWAAIVLLGWTAVLAVFAGGLWVITWPARRRIAARRRRRAAQYERLRAKNLGSRRAGDFPYEVRR